jgi:hypothetical protein
MEIEIEFLLNAMTFPNDPQLLNDPNVWIADMGATGYTDLCIRLERRIYVKRKRMTQSQ